MRWYLGLGVVAACVKAPVTPSAPGDSVATAPAQATVAFHADADAEGLQLRLYDAKPDAGAEARLPTPATTPLDAAQVATLLGRLPPLATAAGDQVEFALRQGSPPPPRTGATVEVAFPPAEDGSAPPAADAGPLTVVRRAPEGEVPMAPQLSVTFSRPMVAVTSQAEAAKTVPVTLTPTPKGTWRWLGTRTLVFQPDKRFPMATRYTAAIPAGTRSAEGKTLDTAVSWAFATPPLTLQSHWPSEGGDGRYAHVGDPQGLSPVVFLGFDQAIDPAALLPHLALRGADASPLRLATAAEIAASPRVAEAVGAAEPGRALAVVPTAPLDRSTTYDVVVAPGSPSAEGPVTTMKEQSFSFRTHGALTVEGPTCWNQHPCAPTSPWNVTFSNPLDLERFDPARITVEPAVPGLEVTADGSAVQIFGAFAGRTTYTVHVAAGVTDVFGQALEKAYTASIDVGPAEQSLVGPDQSFVTLDPAGPPVVSFFTTNHKTLHVKVYRAAATDWPAWIAWLQQWRWEDARKAPLPGTQVLDTTVTVTAEADRRAETKVDLAPYLKGASGQFIVQVEPGTPPKDRWNRQEWLGWVQVSKLGLTVFQEPEALTVWATDLADGQPRKDAAISLLGSATTNPASTNPATTGPDGLARVALPETNATAVLARAGADEAILPASPDGYGGNWVRVEQLDQLRWYVFDDKNLYKPGETVHVRGWLRTQTPGPDGTLADAKATGITWRAFSSENNPLGDGTIAVSKLGGFTFDLVLPKTPNLGTARIELAATGANAGGSATQLAFDIEEYRTPEFEVSASGGDGVYTLGEDATVDVSARYYAGGGLPSAHVAWSVSAAPASFVPPGRSDWSFGPWSPWWGSWDTPEGGTPPTPFEGVTDASGEHHLGIHFESLRPARPMTVTAEATVQDVNRQAWTASKSFLVHPAAWYVGLKTARSWVEAKAPLSVDAIVVDRDGHAVTGAPVDLAFRRLEWKRTAKGWAEVPEDVATARVEGGAGTTTFTPAVGGSYAVVATIHDAQGRRNETELRVWVSGDQVVPDRGVAQEQVTLVPEKQSYAVGETATVLVQAPFWPAEGVLTVRAGGLLETRTFHVAGASTPLSVPVTERHMPDFTVAVDLVGARARSGDDGEPRADLPKRVAYAAGSLTFQVPPRTRTLTVGVTPVQAKLDPGASTSIDLVVTDATGAPVPGAELAVVAVDQAVLALTGYKLPDPLQAFYAARGDGVGVSHLREWVRLVDPNALSSGLGQLFQGVGQTTGLGGLGTRGMGPGGGGTGLFEDGIVTAPPPPPSPAVSRALAAFAKSDTASEAEPDEAPAPDAGSAGGAIALRSDFSAVALWVPAVTTDAAGKARVPLELPDSLTRYRVMVVAVAGDRLFGSGEADVTARLPLMIRPSAPRFLDFGDRFELPVVVQNQTDAPLTVDVAARAANLGFLGKITDPLPTGAAAAAGVAGQRVVVPANDRVEVRFPAAAALAGTARIQLAASAGAYADAASVELPVQTPATTEAFATYGSFDGGEGDAIVQPVTPPKGVWPQFGGLEVTVASTQLQALTDAFVYLVKYPYDCNEQIASRLLGVAALRDVLGAFGSPELPSAATLQATVDDDLAHLARRQNDDGGWAFWRRGDASWPFLGVHVTEALVRAKAKGYTVDDRMYRRALAYNAQIESHLPAWYSRESKWALRAAALDVLSLAGQPNVGKAQALVNEAGVDALGAEALGWLLPTLVDGKATKQAEQVRGWLANHVTESAAGAHFVTGYSDGAQVLLDSDRVADGVVLEALLRTDPQNDVIPKLVNGLLAHRTAGRWENTTESARVLLALDRYFHVYEGVTPAFVAKVWLGDGVAGDHAFEGRTTDRAQIDVPMAWLQHAGPKDLTIGRQGAGRLYYRVGMRYAPTDLAPAALDEGFAVERVYEPIDDPGDVTRGADGAWVVKAGARVRVRLTMATPMRRYHVALVDPLPAGLEVLDPDLAVTGAVPIDPTAPVAPYWWWSRTWYEHEDLRDDRVEAFTSLLSDGVYTYTYVARATTPGAFVVPPTKAEEMYSPETFGRAHGDRVIVR